MCKCRAGSVVPATGFSAAPQGAFVSLSGVLKKVLKVGVWGWAGVVVWHPATRHEHSSPGRRRHGRPPRARGLHEQSGIHRVHGRPCRDQNGCKLQRACFLLLCILSIIAQSTREPAALFLCKRSLGCCCHARVLRQAGLIICYAGTGRTASLIAKYRPTVPILALVVPHLKSKGLSWELEGRFLARQFQVMRGGHRFTNWFRKY